MSRTLKRIYPDKYKLHVKAERLRKRSVSTDRDSTNRYFPGQIDDVRIYDKVLSASEVAELYAASLGGLVGHWRLDETSTILDIYAAYHVERIPSNACMAFA